MSCYSTLSGPIEEKKPACWFYSDMYFITKNTSLTKQPILVEWLKSVTKVGNEQNFKMTNSRPRHLRNARLTFWQLRVCLFLFFSYFFLIDQWSILHCTRVGPEITVLYINKHRRGTIGYKIDAFSSGVKIEPNLHIAVVGFRFPAETRLILHIMHLCNTLHH